MANWTRLVRFLDANGQTRLGQPVDASVDVGAAVAAGKLVEVHIIEGDAFNGKVTEKKTVIGQVSQRPNRGREFPAPEESSFCPRKAPFSSIQGRMLYYPLPWS